MAVVITEYSPEHEPQVAGCNARLREHKVKFALEATATSRWLPKIPGRPVFIELFLAVDGTEVRGGYKLRRQNFSLNGSLVPVGNYQGPVSEAAYDRKYLMVGVQMLRAALRQSPCLYALGMGGTQQPLPLLLQASGWTLELIPFLYKMLRPANCLRNLQAVRRTPARRWMLDFAAATGLGTLGLLCLNRWRTRPAPAGNYSCVAVSRFGEWADELWAAVKGDYFFTAVRDQANQDTLYPETNSTNIKLRIQKDGVDIGWAVVRNTRMKDDKYFGNLQLGSLVDCLARAGEEHAVAEQATRFLQAAGADLVITNQSHERWIGGLRRAGYGVGPSNFAIACSPQLVKQLGTSGGFRSQIHFNRGDGDGPIHL